MASILAVDIVSQMDGKEQPELSPTTQVWFCMASCRFEVSLVDGELQVRKSSLSGDDQIAVLSKFSNSIIIK